MFKLIQLELENFLCFREKQSIDFTEINFPLLVLGENRNEFVKDSQKIIFGSNGAGKTSFFTAIVFALFNFSEKFNLDNLINNVSKKNLIVRLVFEKNEKTYTIFKFRKHKEFKNSTFLLEGNVDYKQLVEKYNSESMNMSSNEVETIKQLIGFDEKIFFQTIFFSQKKLTNFFEKSKNERYKIFELILENLEIFNQIKESAKELYKNSENEVEKLDFVYNDRENKLLNIEKELNEKEKEFAEKKKEFNEKEKEIKEKIKNLITEEKYKTILEEYEKFLITKNDIKNKLTEEETNETTYKNETDEIKNELEIYNDFDKKEYEEITKKINDIRNELIALDNEYTIKNSEYEKENTETSIFFNKIENEKINVNNLLKQLEKLNKDKEKFVEAVDTINKNQKAICPVCKQEITNKHLIEIQKEIELINKDIEEINEKINKSEKVIKENEDKINNKKINIDKKLTELNIIKEKIINKMNEETLLKKDKNTMKYLKIKNVDEFLTNKENLLIKIKNIEENYKKNKEKLKKEIALLKSEFEKNKEIVLLKEKAENELKEKNDLENKINIEKINLEKIKDLIDYIKKEKEGLKKEKEKAGKELEIVNDNKINYKFWVDNIDLIKKDIVNKIIAFFNEKLNFLLTFFFTQNIEIKFDTEFNYEINFNNAVYNDIDFFSGGEERRINIACNLALFLMLRDFFNIDFNYVFFDEILDINLDSVGIKGMINVIEYLYKVNINSVIISHREEYKNYFENFIKIVKEKEISKILY